MSVARTALVVVWLWVLACAKASAGDPCVNYKSLISGQPQSSALGYRPRGIVGKPDRRCEGLFEADRSGEEEVVLFSATAGRIQFDPQSTKPIFVAAAEGTPTANSIAIRATSSSPALHYQLDATIRGAETFEWPPKAVLGPKGIQPDQIGVVGWTGYDGVKLYIPLRLEQAVSAPPGLRRIYLKIFTAVPLAQIRWRVGIAKKSGNELNCVSGAEWTYKDDVASFEPMDVVVPAGGSVLQCLEAGTKRSFTATWRRSTVTFAGIR